MNHKQRLEKLQEALSRQEFKTQGELTLAHFMVSIISCMKAIVADMDAVTATAKTAEAVEPFKRLGLKPLTLKAVEARIKEREAREADTPPPSGVDTCAMGYPQLWDNFYLRNDPDGQMVTVEEIDPQVPMWADNGASNARHLLLQIKLGVYEDVDVNGVNRLLYWSKQVLAELEELATKEQK